MRDKKKHNLEGGMDSLGISIKRLLQLFLRGSGLRKLDLKWESVSLWNVIMEP